MNFYETTRTAEVIQVIVTESLRGAGINSDPVRVVKQYWSFDGTLLAENDPHKGEDDGSKNREG